MEVTVIMATASDKLKNNMEPVLDKLQAEPDRVELLAAALDGFQVPLFNYEPIFRHLPPPRARASPT